MSNSPAGAAERIVAQQRAMQGKMLVCEKCGGQHFHEVQVTKYLAGGYGTVEIQADTTDQVFPVLVCLCGQPVMPKPAVGRRAHGTYEGAQKDMRESMVKATTFRDSQDPKKVLEGAAGVHIEKKVADLEAQLIELKKDLGNGTD